MAVLPKHASFRMMARLSGVLAVTLLAIVARPAARHSSALTRDRYLSPLEIAVSPDGHLLYVVCQEWGGTQPPSEPTGQIVAFPAPSPGAGKP